MIKDVFYKVITISIFIVGIFTFVFVSNIVKLLENIPDTDARFASSFIVGTRYVWNSVLNDFKESREFVMYISLPDSQMHVNVINEKIKNIDKHIEFLKSINISFGDDKNQRLTHNVIFLITNATNILKRAMNEEDPETISNLINDANKEIEMANTYFMEIATDYEFDIKPLNLLQEEKFKYEIK